MYIGSTAARIVSLITSNLKLTLFSHNYTRSAIASDISENFRIHYGSPPCNLYETPALLLNNNGGARVYSTRRVFFMDIARRPFIFLSFSRPRFAESISLKFTSPFALGGSYIHVGLFSEFAPRLLLRGLRFHPSTRENSFKRVFPLQLRIFPALSVSPARDCSSYLIPALLIKLPL